MEIVTQTEPKYTVVSVSGRLDSVTAQELEKSCVSLVAGGGKFIFDLSRLEYVSSAGLRSVLVIAKKLKGTGGSLVLCGLTGLVQEVFAISGFDSFLPVCSTLEEAAGKV